jgi:hypothetical protein
MLINLTQACHRLKIQHGTYKIPLLQFLCGLVSTGFPGCASSMPGASVWRHCGVVDRLINENELDAQTVKILDAVAESGPKRLVQRALPAFQPSSSGSPARGELRVQARFFISFKFVSR